MDNITRAILMSKLKQNHGFDPLGVGYDYETAMLRGMAPDETGHWSSREPNSGQILKGMSHETINKTIQGENDAGYKIYQGKDGKYYSFSDEELLQRLNQNQNPDMPIAGRPMSAITGLPVPTDEQNIDKSMEFVAKAKMIGKYLADNATGASTVYEEVPKEYYDTPSIFAEPRQEPLMAEIPDIRKISASKWKTGDKITFDFIHNTEKAPQMGGRFGQDLEPSGKYIQKKYSVSDISKMPNMEEGKVTFENPLVLDWGGGYGESSNWKKVLSDKYDGKTGIELSRAIKKDGYDGVITWDKKHNEPSEIVDLRGINKSEANAVKDLAGMKRYEALGLDSPVTARDKMTATEELATLKQTSKTKFSINETTGNLDPSTEIFPIATMAKNERANWFKSILKTPEAKEYMRGLEMNRNKSAIHPNSKTGISMDFSTDCPERLAPCPYCYVEHGRNAEKLFNMKGNNKVIVETPYRREILAMPREMVERANGQGGMRAHSFSDYRPTQDYNQWELALQDAEAKGLYIKAITKQSEFVHAFGDHPNLRLNISVDWLPREMSNSPTMAEALALKAGRENIKIRTVALNEEQAWKMAADPNVNVVTMYHGLTGDKLKQILMAQNKGLIDKVGKERLWKEIESWQNMPGNSKAFKRLAEKYPNKICCQSGKCGGDPTKCGFGMAAAGGLIAGVILPEFLDDEGGSDSPSMLAGQGL
jgi:hypothetical protein